MEISVRGLGYIRRISAACHHTVSHNLLSVDCNNTEVDLINPKSSPVVMKNSPEDANARQQLRPNRILVLTDEDVLAEERYYAIAG